MSEIKDSGECEHYNPELEIERINISYEILEAKYKKLKNTYTALESSYINSEMNLNILLEEKQQHEQGCEYCNNNKSLFFNEDRKNPYLKEVYLELDGNITIDPASWYKYDDNDDSVESVQIKINYCPMCGKPYKEVTK